MSLPFMQPFTGVGGALQTMQGGGGPVGGWVELGRTTAGSTTDNISVSSLPNKRYYMVLFNNKKSGSAHCNFRFNTDTGSNYTYRYNYSHGSDVTGTSQSFVRGSSTTSGEELVVAYIANLPGEEKLVIGNSCAGLAPGGNKPTTLDFVGKWANTSDSISEIRAYNNQSGSYASGAELIVLGWDSLDTHNTNAWEELVDVELTSDGSLDTGTFTGKRYMWLQAYSAGAGSGSPDMYVKLNDSTSTYPHRYSGNDGGSVASSGSSYGVRVDSTGGTTPKFLNTFMSNITGLEKMMISYSITQNAAGAGTTPSRTESGGKWTNTTDNVTKIQINNQSAIDHLAGSRLKVWGFD